MVSIKNLKRSAESLGWSWDIDGIHYSTNNNGEGIWKECECGHMVFPDGRAGTATTMKQIEGTCQYSMMGCNSYNSAYKHIRRYFEEVV